MEVDYLPVRYLNEYVYCPRLGYLEWVEAEFKNNFFTLDGTLKHAHVDVEGVHRKKVDVESIHQRSVYVSSERLGLTGRIDLLEETEGELCPVEYKRGKIPDVPGGAYEPEKVQLCAYGLMLKESGHRCERGFLYYVDSRRRVEIPFSAELMQSTHEYIAAFKKTALEGEIPPPLKDSPKCRNCSLIGICLPDEINLLSCSDDEGKESVRRLVPAREDALAVYITEPGAYVSKAGDLMVIKGKGERDKLEEVRLNEVSQLCVFGNVQITTQLLRELCGRDIPVCFFSGGGWFYGIAHAHSSKNAVLRMAQFATCQDERLSLRIARNMVCGKIKNCRTMLRRNHSQRPLDALRDLAVLHKKAAGAGRREELLGLEGAAARRYFQVFSGMLKGGQRDGELDFCFEGRNRRPPGDPVNALLSFVYSMLVKDLTVTLLSVGLDPYIGVFHRPRHGRPALALDLAEEFRPLIGDSVVLALVNNQEVKREDFLERMESVSMSKQARFRLLSAYERRMDTLIRHPVFGYTISYRRVFEVQARLLARVFEGELLEYKPFCTR